MKIREIFFSLLLAGLFPCPAFTQDSAETRPKLSLSQAAALAEAELKAMGVSETHFIKILSFQSSEAGYYATIEPPIPEDSANPDGKKIMLIIDMDGKVLRHGLTITRRRIEREGSQNPE